MPDRLTAYLGPFSNTVVEAVRARVAAGAIVVLSDESCHEFRLTPAVCLDRVFSRLEAIWRTGSDDAVVWCQSGNMGTGLEAYELAAVLDRWLHVERAEQAAGPEGRHVVVLGRLRHERMVVTATSPSEVPADIHAWLSALAERALPVLAMIPVSAVATGVETRLAEPVARLLAAGGDVGLTLAPADRDHWMPDPAETGRAFEAATSRPLRFVRFSGDPPSIDAHHRFMRLSGSVIDLTFSAGTSGPPAATVRTGPFTGSRPYCPQPFDLRVPLFLLPRQPWFVLPRVEITLPLVEPWWDGMRGRTNAELEARLDASRMESFFRRCQVDFSAEREYAEVRIYNWPPSAAPIRTSMLDAGRAAAEDVAALCAALAGLGRREGVRVSVAPARDCVDAVRDEVLQQYSITEGHSIAIQAEEHGYLALLPHDAPLREDYAHFTRFVPAALGTTLELGSGFGVLAWTLTPRATRYVCVDLDRQMFAKLRRDLRQDGLVADMHKLPFADASFDSVVANNVLEHLYDPLAGLREVRRVLKPGGRLFTLIPYDALNPGHNLPAHHWKLDDEGLRLGMKAAGFSLGRHDVVNLHDLGVSGAFPTCYGWAAMFEAVNGDGVSPGLESIRVSTPRAAGSLTRKLAGRHVPMVREHAMFEAWRGQPVVVVGGDGQDADEFDYYGAAVHHVAPGERWPLANGAARLVYAFLSVSVDGLDALAAEARRVLAAGGRVVAVFRNREGLRYAARLQSFYGEACELRALAGPDGLVAVADDDGAVNDREYLRPSDVRAAFAAWTSAEVSVRNLTPEDLCIDELPRREPVFWEWLAATHGRYILLKATA